MKSIVLYPDDFKSEKAWDELIIKTLDIPDGEETEFKRVTSVVLYIKDVLVGRDDEASMLSAT